MNAPDSESEIQQLLIRLQNDSAKKRENAIFEIRRKQIVDERIVLELVRMAASDPKDYVRDAAKFTLSQPKFQTVVRDSTVIIAERRIISERLYWPPEQTGTGTIFGYPRHATEERELRKQQRKATIGSTKSLLISKSKYAGGHPLISQSLEVVLSLTERDFVIYSIDGGYGLTLLSSIPLLDITKASPGRPKTAREVYDSDDQRTIDVIQHSPFLSIAFNLQGYSYTASFEDFEKSTNPQDWANMIIAQQYRLRNVNSHSG